jgi:enoyl-CoA hydratase
MTITSQEYETIRCQQEGYIRRVTLNRPEVLNALDGRMLREIREVLADSDADEDTRVLLIDSSCEKAFSAGIDVAYVKDMRGSEARLVGRELHKTFLALRTTEIMVVTAIDGLCLGAGLELALSCDFMLATPRSKFGLPNIHRGIPAIVEAAILPGAIGIQGAREMAYTGKFWDAQRAERRGLINAIFPPEEFQASVNQWCEELAEKSPVAIGTQKEIIHKWMTTDLESAIDFSINTVVINFNSKDQKDAMGAFIAKSSDSTRKESANV